MICILSVVCDGSNEFGVMNDENDEVMTKRKNRE